MSKPTSNFVVITLLLILMRNLIFISTALFVLVGLFQSCSKDEVSLNDKENSVKVVVDANTTDVPIFIEGFPIGAYPIKVRGHWENEDKTKLFAIRSAVRCEDESVLLTIKIFVNGKLRKKEEGYSEINAWVDLK